MKDGRRECLTESVPELSGSIYLVGHASFNPIPLRGAAQISDFFQIFVPCGFLFVYRAVSRKFWLKFKRIWKKDFQAKAVKL